MSGKDEMELHVTKGHVTVFQQFFRYEIKLKTVASMDTAAVASWSWIDTSGVLVQNSHSNIVSSPETS